MKPKLSTNSLSMHIRFMIAMLSLVGTATCLQRSHHHWRRAEVSTLDGDDTLKEAFILLNAGKKALGLRTENPAELLKVAEDPAAANSEEVVKEVLEDNDVSKEANGEQYVVLTGDEGHGVHIQNFTNFTEAPHVKPKSNESDVQDVFKMILEKKVPEEGLSHNITIVETNEVKTDNEDKKKHRSVNARNRRNKKKKPKTEDSHCRKMRELVVSSNREKIGRRSSRNSKFQSRRRESREQKCKLMMKNLLKFKDMK